MARPKQAKTELKYFNIDCIDDEKLEFLKVKNGIAGWGCYWAILQTIYGNEGYFVDWSTKRQILFANRNGLTTEQLSEIIETCLDEELFSKELLEKEGILTSKGIQERYIKICKEAKRKHVSINPEFDLIDFNKNIKNSSNGNNTDTQQSDNSEQFPNSSRTVDEQLPKKKKKEKEKEKESKIPPFNSPQGGQEKNNEFGKVDYFEKLPRRAQTLMNFTNAAEVLGEEKFNMLCEFAEYRKRQYTNINVQEELNQIIEDFKARTPEIIRVSLDHAKKNGYKKKIVWQVAADKNGKFANVNFPNEWSKAFEMKLQGNQLPAYWAHLRSLGLSPVKHKGVTVKWVKKNEAIAA